MADTEVQKGDQVSWKWGSGRPSGEVADVATEGDLSITSNKGNTIKKNASEDDPAVHVAREGNDVVKRAHELTIDEKASDSKDDKPKENGAAKENGDAKATKKHDLDDKELETPGDEDEELADKAEKKEDKEPAAKKQKVDPAEKKDAADDGKKARGRPKKSDSNGTAKGASKKKEPKPAATADGKPRRSARNAA